jgi:ZIP family zinc transporter
MYISFIEIFQKSVGSFQDSGIDESKSLLYATICFFGGTLIMQLMDVLIRIVGGRDHHKTKVDKEASNSNVVNNIVTVVAPHCIGCSDDPVTELKEWHRKADEEIKYGSHGLQLDGTIESSSELPVPSGEDVVDVTVDVSGKEVNKNLDDDKEASAGSVSGMSTDNSDTYNKEEKKRLIQMGLRTALAIALHNFPEGLATFVAALEDPRVGAVLAIAIGIHNIPEGLCVSLPVYYATGNRLKGFLWGTISGFSEPFGAFIGWLILSRYMGDVIYAILFGVVAGMMVLISLKELLPTAFRYDPEDTVITHACISGMVFMALSLVLFTV